MRDHTRAGRALRALLVVVMVLPLIGYFAPAASAHHPILSVDGICNPEAGEWEITWTVANGNWSGRTMTVDQVDYSDNQLTDIKPGLVLGPDATESDTVWYPLSDLGVKTLTVRADWSDGGTQNVTRSLSIDLGKLDASECPAGTITVIKNTENPETSREFTFLLDAEEEFSNTQAVCGRRWQLYLVGALGGHLRSDRTGRSESFRVFADR